MGIIYCVGENLEQREAEQTSEIIYSQLESVKESLDQTDWKNVILAYEPIWALNTGKIASADQTEEALETIREWLNENCSKEIADQI